MSYEGESLDQPEAAIANYDAWPKPHGEDADRASAYTGRCRARALLNRDSTALFPIATPP